LETLQAISPRSSAIANQRAGIIGQVLGRKDEIKKIFNLLYQKLRKKALSDINKIPQYFFKQSA
jgi:hypothetical protein